MEKKVLTEDEVLNLKGLREKYQSLTETLGVVEMQNLNIKIKKEQLKLSL